MYLFEFFDKLGSFNTTLHIKADVHFDLSKGVSQFDDGNLATRDTSSNTEHNLIMKEHQVSVSVHKLPPCNLLLKSSKTEIVICFLNWNTPKILKVMKENELQL